jgi:protein gp37
MNRTSIDWAEYSWNPVTGCLHGCDYCYARRIAERFHGPDGFKPTFHGDRLNDPLVYEKPKRIFVCSMADLFGDWVSREWQEKVLAACDAAPQHQYLFLTKNPRGAALRFGTWPVHKNWWIGATADDKHNMVNAVSYLAPLHNEGWHTWLSCEPLIDDVAEVILDRWYGVDWLVIGAMTGPGSKNRQPQREWIRDLAIAADNHGIPVFMKRSLQTVVDETLIQQYPKEMMDKKP